MISYIYNVFSQLWNYLFKHDNKLVIRPIDSKLLFDDEDDE